MSNNRKMNAAQTRGKRSCDKQCTMSDNKNLIFSFLQSKLVVIAVNVRLSSNTETQTVIFREKRTGTYFRGLKHWGTENEYQTNMENT